MTNEIEKPVSIIVLARDYKAYARFIRKHKLQGKCRYVVDESDLTRGLVKGEYVVVKYGDWFNNQFYYAHVSYLLGTPIGGIREMITTACENAKEVREVV